MSLPLYWIYPLYTGILAIALVALVPKSQIRKLAYYAIILGGMADALLILVVTHVVGAGGYLNYLPFGFTVMPFFPPIAWVAYFIMFLHFLPDKQPWIYIYIASSALYSMLFSNVLLNLGIFTWNYGRLIVPLLIYFPWQFTAAWIYQRYEK
ncbi:hypothetical protein MFMK1_000997 [Metallumcola ferriviriculae]|uniref:Rod shape-determining protein MreD n=1 Tax=Metallumcola ferriviriculae TaxID=3039180 RepID=A0AAU0ULY2_9FIRM|nr:hypothetical protein MFMK1_000997 [Desulfitibacteraceae bacterium MK1]